MITVKNLSKKYEHAEALKGISFSVNKGDIYGLLGRSGAGKTTVINILSAVTKHDAGEISINGIDVSKDAEKIKNIVGVTPHGIWFKEELTAIENIIAQGNLQGLPSSALQDKAGEVLKLVGLFEKKDDKIKTYSDAMKRRAGIASAILHGPEIVFMEEPTASIGKEDRIVIYELIEKLNKQGITIIYATHDIEEVELLCNRIGIMDKGKMLAQGTLDELRTRARSKQSICIQISNIKDERVENENLISKFIGEELTEVPGGNFRFRSGTLQYFTTDIESNLNRLKNRLLKFGFEIAKVDIERSDLESVFASLVENN